MIQPLESRQLFAATPMGHLAPAGEPVAEGEVGVVVVASNDLGPDNVQKKHVATHKSGPANYN